MTTPRVQLSDQLVKSALSSREVRSGARADLVADVLRGVDYLPQDRRIRLDIFGGVRLVPILAVLALVLATVALAAFGGQALLQVVGGDGTIAYTSGTPRWTGEWEQGSQDVVLDDPAVFAVPAVGGEPMRLLDLPADTPPQYSLFKGDHWYHPGVKWSRDGSMFAYRQFGDADSGPGIYVASRDGSGRRLLAAADARAPRDYGWSPDGARIAFTTRYPTQGGERPVGSAMMVDVASGKVTSAIPGQDVPASGSVAWSPDGSKIAFGRNEDRARSVLVIVDLRDGRLTTIAGSNRDGLNWNQVGAIAWSPDSRTVAFDNDRIGPGPMTTNPVGGPSQDAYLMIVNADGTGLHEIDRRPMGGCCIVGAFLGYLEWSPNGDLIAWGYHGGIVLAPADGSGVRRTVDGFVFYDWSPNGDRLVVVGEGPPIPGSPTMCQGDPNLPPQPCSTNSASIFTMRPDGTDRTWIADGSYPTWLPAAW